MGLSFSKLFSSKTEKATISDTTEHIINEIEAEPYGISNENVLYGGLNELGGYYFFQTVIVGKLKLKTKTGAQVKLSGKTCLFKLKSDMDELASEPTNVKGRWLTKIDFQIEEADIKHLSDAILSEIEIITSHNTITFKKYQSLEDSTH